MRAILLCLSIFLVLNLSKIFTNAIIAQDITIDDFNSLSGAAQYNYNGDSYVVSQPWIAQQETGNLPLMAQALAVRQARYDYGLAMIKGEYAKLKSLRLINADNQRIVEEHRARVTDFLKGKGGRSDFSIQANVSPVIKYIIWIYSLESIRHEILLTQKLNTRFIRLKQKEPDTFYNSSDFSGIKKIIAELKATEKESISAIAVQNGLF